MADARRITYGSPGCLSQNTGPSISTFVINGTTDQYEVIFQAQEDITCTKLGYYCSTVTAPPILTICLQGVTRTGSTTIPDGTILGGGSPASATFTPSAGWTWVTLANSIALTRGTWYSYVVKYSSGTVGGSNNATFGTGNPAFGILSQPSGITNDAGSRTIGTSANLPVFGYASSTTAYGAPLSGTAQTLFNSASASDEYAIKFTIPANFCSTYKVLGMRWLTAIETANTNTCKIVLYSGTTVAAVDSTGAVTEKTVQQDSTFSNCDFISGSFRIHEVWFDESTLASLVAGATYRLGVQPQNGASNGIYVARIQVAAAADFAAYPGGTDIAMSSRADAGNWTDSTTDRILGDMVISDLTAPAGGGGGGAIFGSGIFGGK